MLVAGGSTDVTTYFKLRLAADGTAATGLTIADMDLQYVRSGVAPVAKVDAIALAATDTAHTDNFAIEIDATDQPGLYRVDWPDAAFVAGVREVILTVKIATAFSEDKSVEIDGEVNVVEWAGTDVVTGAIPAVAADAAGGLAISDAGGLDLDAKLANTNEVTTVRMATLTDWIDGGRLDLLLDAVKAVTDLLPDSGALSTIGTDTARLTAVRAAVLTDWIDGGRLDLLLDAILLDTGELQTDDVPGLIAALNDLSAAQVNDEVDTALATTTYAEPGSRPPATTSIQAMTHWLFTLSVNLGLQTSALKTLRNDGNSADIATATVSDDGTTFTRNEWT